MQDNHDVPKCEGAKDHEWDEKFAGRYCKRCDVRRETVGHLTKWRYFKEKSVKCGECGKDHTAYEELGISVEE